MKYRVLVDNPSCSPLRKGDIVDLVRKSGSPLAVTTDTGFEWYVLCDEVEPIPENDNDLVTKPSHYNQYGIECIEAIRAALGPEFSDYCRGNVMKYLWRYKYKNGVEDLRKARVYLDWLLEAEESK